MAAPVGAGGGRPYRRARDACSRERKNPGTGPTAGAALPGLAAYRQQDAGWFFGRERSTAAFVAQLRAAENTGGLVMLVGASGAGKSSLLNAGLVPALRDRSPDGGTGPPRTVLPLVPGADPLGELSGRIPGLASVIAAGRREGAEPGGAEFERAVRAAFTAWARDTTAAPTAARSPLPGPLPLSAPGVASPGPSASPPHRPSASPPPGSSASPPAEPAEATEAAEGQPTTSAGRPDRTKFERVSPSGGRGGPYARSARVSRPPAHPAPAPTTRRPSR
ncbi:hypothetical protein H4N49_17575 [Streptomyces sp. DHE17-7]|nr:ABC transporter ATP-binding protein [Streptomyces sp. DHE17-7]MBJ6620459.1 hypothetical protein [Streptomyces sp. DHE17-7]